MSAPHLNLIDGRWLPGDHLTENRNPSDLSDLIGHYAAATTEVDPRLRAHAFDRATHYLLDTRLMMAWARTLAEAGQLDPARHIAARLREFDKTDAEAFFAPCPLAASAPAPGLPFQCETPRQVPSWQAMLPLHP